MRTVQGFVHSAVLGLCKIKQPFKKTIVSAISKICLSQFECKVARAWQRVRSAEDFLWTTEGAVLVHS